MLQAIERLKLPLAFLVASQRFDMRNEIVSRHPATPSADAVAIAKSSEQVRLASSVMDTAVQQLRSGDQRSQGFIFAESSRSLTPAPRRVKRPATAPKEDRERKAKVGDESVQTPEGRQRQLADDVKPLLPEDFRRMKCGVSPCGDTICGGHSCDRLRFTCSAQIPSVEEAEDHEGFASDGRRESNDTTLLGSPEIATDMPLDYRVDRRGNASCILDPAQILRF